MFMECVYYGILSYALLKCCFSVAFGNECGLAIVDIIQKTCLLNMGTPDLYGESFTICLNNNSRVLLII